MDKYLSILTNFGCHFTCAYCISKKNGISIPKTTVQSLDGLDEAIVHSGATIISVSGGGDPLFDYTRHMDFYDRLFETCDKWNLPLEMHTSYIDSPFPYEKCHRVVYHVRWMIDLDKIKRHGNEKVRVVFVMTPGIRPCTIDAIADYVEHSSVIDELSFRQMVGENYETQYHNHDYLKAGHKKRWWYIEQDDYNTYYVDGRITDSYKSLIRAS